MRRARRVVAALVLVIAAAAPARPARAQAPSHTAGTPELRAELLAEPTTPSAAAPATRVLLRLHVAPGWHVYWHQPGETGLPTVVEWELPVGWRVQDTRWPVPARLAVEGVVAHVLRDEVPLLVSLRAPSPARGPALVRATVRYGVCREVCIPQRLQLALRLPAAPTASAAAEWRAALAAAAPRLAAPLASADVRAFRDSDALCVGVRDTRGPRSDSLVFFPADAIVLPAAAVLPARRRGGWTWLRLPLPAGAAPAARLRGTLAGGAGGGAPAGVELDVPVAAGVAVAVPDACRSGPHTGA